MVPSSTQRPLLRFALILAELHRARAWLDEPELPRRAALAAVCARLDEALARHATFSRIFALTRIDTTVTWWVGSETFHGEPPPARLISLTPLIDVTFLILIFFIVRKFSKFEVGKDAIQKLATIAAYAMALNVFFFLLDRL